MDNNLREDFKKYMLEHPLVCESPETISDWWLGKLIDIKKEMYFYADGTIRVKGKQYIMTRPEIYTLINKIEIL